VAEKIPDPPPSIRPRAPEPPRSLGVVNGKATHLPIPPYPAAAISLNIKGEVAVQVTIDEYGKVVSAKAVSGHPLLRRDSERAAMNARFSPTTLSKVPVKVTGVIVYNFKR
jgi:protein TonB